MDIFSNYVSKQPVRLIGTLEYDRTLYFWDIFSFQWTSNDDLTKKSAENYLLSFFRTPILKTD